MASALVSSACHLTVVSWLTYPILLSGLQHSRTHEHVGQPPVNVVDRTVKEAVTPVKNREQCDSRGADEKIELELGHGFYVDGGSRLLWRFARALVLVGLGHGPVPFRRLPASALSVLLCFYAVAAAVKINPESQGLLQDLHTKWRQTQVLRSRRSTLTRNGVQTRRRLTVTSRKLSTPALLPRREICRPGWGCHRGHFFSYKLDRIGGLGVDRSKCRERKERRRTSANLRLNFGTLWILSSARSRLFSLKWLRTLHFLLRCGDTRNVKGRCDS